MRSAVIAAVAAVAALQCALADGAVLYGFGNANANDFSCSAIGTNVTCATQPCSLCNPTEILDGVASVCTGRSHTLVLLSNGTVLGTGAQVMLGLGVSDVTSSSPCLQQSFVQVPLPGLADRVSCNINQSAVRLADGGHYVFGMNQAGQLGLDAAATPIVSSPTLLNLTERLGASTEVNATTIDFGLDIGIFILTNGSVGTMGSGSASLRGSTANTGHSNPVVLPAIPGSCTPVYVAVLLRHAVVNCSDGTAYGWGSNANNQLADSGTSLAEPTLMALPAGVTDAQWTVGSAHTLLLQGSTGSVFGRGSNAAGQLAFPVATVTQATWAAVTQVSGIPMTAVAAGADYSMFMTTNAVYSGSTQGLTNVLVAGANGGCALGLAASVGETFTPETLGFTRHSNLRAIAFEPSEHRRTFMLVDPIYTRSASLTQSRSWSRSASNSTTRATRTFTRSENVTTSLSLEATVTETEVPTPTATRKTPTSTRTATIAATKTVELTQSRTVSNTTEIAPFITSALYVSEFKSINIIFDIATNINNGTAAARSVAEVNAMFVLTGTLQTFGDIYSGYWADNRTFVVLLDSKNSNVTVGVAYISITPGSNIRNADSTSPPSPPFFFVPVTSTASVLVPTDETSGGMPTYLLVLAIVLPLSLGVLILVVAVLFCLARNRKDADEQREPRGREVKTSSEPFDHYPVIREEEIGVQQVTTSTIRGARFDERHESSEARAYREPSPPLSFSERRVNIAAKKNSSIIELGPVPNMPPTNSRREMPRLAAARRDLQLRAEMDLYYAEEDPALKWRAVDSSTVRRHTVEEYTPSRMSASLSPQAPLVEEIGAHHSISPDYAARRIVLEEPGGVEIPSPLSPSPLSD